MIKVSVSREAEHGCITAFTLSGHADYAAPGEDIVCAAISALSFGTINAIHQLLNIELEISMDQQTGFLHCFVPKQIEPVVQEKMQLLLEGMLVSMHSVASEYGKYVSITDQ